MYTDGIQDGYPFVFQGRDNGIVYWGDFAKKIKISVGAFDGKSATGKPKILGAARIQIDSLSIETTPPFGSFFSKEEIGCCGSVTGLELSSSADRTVGKGGAEGQYD